MVSKEDGWGSARDRLSASAARELANPEVRPKAKKDRKKWCKGVAGRLHEVMIGIPANRAGWRKDCHWQRWYGIRRPADYYWSCVHVEYCLICGKHVRWQISPEECPDYTEMPK